MPPVDPTTASTEELERQIIAVNHRIRRFVEEEVDHLNKAKAAGDHRAQSKLMLDRLMRERNDPEEHKAEFDIPVASSELQRQVAAVSRRIQGFVETEVDHLNKAEATGNRRAHWKQTLDRLVQELKDRGEDKAGLGDIPVPPDFPTL